MVTPMGLLVATCIHGHILEYYYGNFRWGSTTVVLKTGAHDENSKLPAMFDLRHNCPRVSLFSLSQLALQFPTATHPSFAPT